MVRVPFLWTWVHFRPAFCKTLGTVPLLMDVGIPVFTITLFTRKFPISSCKNLVWRDIFLFCRADSPGCLPWLVFVNPPPSFQYSFAYACRWLLLNTSSMILSLMFLNKSFLHLYVDSSSEQIHAMELFVNF